MPDEASNYIEKVVASASLNDEQEQRLRSAISDLTQLMLEAALNPEDSSIITEINMCKITIESLGVVSFNQIADETKKVAVAVFTKGLSIALASL